MIAGQATAVGIECGLRLFGDPVSGQFFELAWRKGEPLRVLLASQTLHLRQHERRAPITSVFGSHEIS
jgi:hypothetical protein